MTSDEILSHILDLDQAPTGPSDHMPVTEEYLRYLEDDIRRTKEHSMNQGAYIAKLQDENLRLTRENAVLRRRPQSASAADLFIGLAFLVIVGFIGCLIWSATVAPNTLVLRAVDAQR
ncbi:MAG: hypothetical protein KGL39_55915 [Patescibacteria group bacterium]|nr:hypothetical protein [Patescibacteria group bacterium]